MPESVGYCRELAASEPLAGTATESVSRWVLLEDGDPWGRKPPRDSELAEPVQRWLLAQDARPDTRVQLIRRPGASRGPRRRLYLVDAPEYAPGRRTVELELELAELPALELPEDLEDLEALGARTLDAPLWLVCTHGTRDRCCAKWGVPLWDRLVAKGRERVWQSSHLGGHRFAPTLVCLPAGLMWGRIQLDQAEALWTAAEAGQLALLDQLRGRCCHPRPVQAAECFVRSSAGLVDDGAVRLASWEEIGEDHYRVELRVRDAAGAVQAQTLELHHRLDPKLLTAGGCGDPLEPRSRYELRSL